LPGIIIVELPIGIMLWSIIIVELPFGLAFIAELSFIPTLDVFAFCVVEGLVIFCCAKAGAAKPTIKVTAATILTIAIKFNLYMQDKLSFTDI
jgi:hypothetical protein